MGSRQHLGGGREDVLLVLWSPARPALVALTPQLSAPLHELPVLRRLESCSNVVLPLWSREPGHRGEVCGGHPLSQHAPCFPRVGGH